MNQAAGEDKVPDPAGSYIAIPGGDEKSVMDKPENEISAELAWSTEKKQPSRPPSGFTAEQISRKIGHELRSQLTGTSGLLDMLLESELNASQKNYAESIKCSIMTMLYMVNGIHDMIRLENGTFKPANSRFNIERMFDDHEFLFRALAAERGLGLRFQLYDDVPRELFGDARRIGVVLYHLITNAVHYSDRGTIQVSAMVLNDGSEDESETRLLFEVSDEGEGLPEEVHQAFLNEKSISHSLFLDRGMGLLTCRELISNLGGKIRVVTEGLAMGTAIQFWLPFQRSAPMAELDSIRLQPQRSRSVKIPMFSDASKTVLLADDDPVNRKFVSKLLEKQGICTFCVSNGEEAIEAFNSGYFDLVILDCNMPVMTGFESTRLIRESDRRTGRQTPILVWSATNSDVEKVEALSAGADEFILKPIDSKFLLEVVARKISNEPTSDPSPETE